MAATVLVVGAGFRSFIYAGYTHKFEVGLIVEVFGNREQGGRSILSRILGFFFQPIDGTVIPPFFGPFFWPFFGRIDGPVDRSLDSPVFGANVCTIVARIIVACGCVSEFGASVVEQKQQREAVRANAIAIPFS